VAILTKFHIIILVFHSFLSLAYGYESTKSNVSESVVINASIEDVWEYNSINENAREWSVYFYKIVACPTDDCPSNNLLQSHDIGFTRRCYKTQDEQGVYWDEKTTKIEKDLENKYFYKQMIAFNFNNLLNFMNFSKKGEFLVEQFYKRLSKNQTKLTFKTSLIKRKELAKKTSRFEYFAWKTYFALKGKRDIRKTFKKNLINIKAAIEQGDNFQRVHPFEE